MSLNRNEIALEAIRLLREVYPDASCTLTYKESWQLLVAVRLAAQCTDKRVDEVTPILFGRFPTVPALAEADVSEIEAVVRPCGLGNSKARDISACMKMLHECYNDEVPDTFAELLKLPGVGRKSAHLIMGDIFHKPAIVTDTHCIRICGRLSLSEGKDPYKVEKALKEVIPPEEGSDFCHRLVAFGREICTARNPKCGECVLRNVCQNHES